MPFEEGSDAQTEAIALLKQRLSGFETEEGRLKGLSYVPQKNDEVVITTTPKAGTTWMQQICHQLRSAHEGGDMNFDEISQVVPWLELAADQGQDLEAPQYGDAQGAPRLFKSHAWERDCPKFPKVIVVVRRPEDVLLSFYKFFEDWFFEPGTIDFDAFAREFWLARGIPRCKMQNASYFVHLTSWYERRHDPNVLFVFFEDLLEDLENQVRRVALFISNDTFRYYVPEIVKVAVKKSSYAYMKEHAYQFDEKLSKQARNEACGLPKDAGMKKCKIAEGKGRKGSLVLSPAIQDEIQKKWEQVVLPRTDCSTYDELRQQVKKTQLIQ